MNVGIPGMGQMQRSLRDAHAHDVKATERIATGKSVNSAKDNAAAFAVSTNLDAFARSRRVLARSLNTQLQISEIADDGLSEVNKLLSRAKELAVQARSETLNSDERRYAQGDFAATLEEINRIAQTTKYRDKPILRFRGIDVGFVVDRSSSMSTHAANVRDTIAAFQTVFDNGKLDAHMGVAHYYEEGKNGGADNNDGTQLFQDIGGDSVEPALQAVVDLRFGGLVDPYSAILNASGVDDPNGDDTFSWREGTLKKILILVTDTNNEANYHSPPQTEATTAATMLNSGIEVHSITNQTAPYNDITTGTGGSQGDLSDMAPTDPDNPLVGAGNIADQLVLELQNQTGGGVRQIGIFNTSNDRVTTPVPVDVTPINLDLADTNISTVDDAGDAMDKLEAAMDNVNSLRAGIGAYQRRLDSIMSSNIQTTETELGAVSTMTDANIAEEVASKMKASMKAQAASTILMQAKKLQRNSIEQLLG